MTIYPSATFRATSITHQMRRATWGVVVHWTAGHEAGDVSVLRGPNVDVQFYIAHSGRVYQFMDPMSEAWHGFHTANHNTIGIETEGSGEAWTTPQFRSMVLLCAWISKRFDIPAVHVHPKSSHPDGSSPPPVDWHGYMGHLDLRGIDGNNHSDTVPPDTGWPKFLAAVQAELTPAPAGPRYSPPWPVFRGATQIGNGNLLNPILISRIAGALHAADKQAPYTAYVGSTVVATGRFWPPGKYTRAISAQLRAGHNVDVEGVVTIKTRKA